MEILQKQTKEKIEQLYREDFDPDDYVKTYYSDMNPEYEFFLTSMHDFFNSKCNVYFNLPILINKTH